MVDNKNGAGCSICIKGLSKHFNTVKAVDGISLEVKKGEMFALLGPNGAGKTTTISMLCGLLMPTFGSAFVAGFDVSKEPLKVRKSIGVVFQQPSVDDLLSGKENLEMHSLLYGMDSLKARERIPKMISLVGLEDRQGSPVKEYSGGMRRRLEIARGMLHEPQILFLDEPTLGLDPQTREHVWKYVKSLSEREGTTVVFTTHYLEEAEKFADRVGIIDHGKIIALGTPKELVSELGGDVVVLKAKEPERILEGISKLKFVKDAKIEGGAVRLTVEDSQKNIPFLLRKLPEIESFELHPATLNDIFIKRTGREMREENGEGGFFERVMNKANDR